MATARARGYRFSRDANLLTESDFKELGLKARGINHSVKKEIQHFFCSRNVNEHSRFTYYNLLHEHIFSHIVTRHSITSVSVRDTCHGK